MEVLFLGFLLLAEIFKKIFLSLNRTDSLDLMATCQAVVQNWYFNFNLVHLILLIMMICFVSKLVRDRNNKKLFLIRLVLVIIGLIYIFLNFMHYGYVSGCGGDGVSVRWSVFPQSFWWFE